MSKDDKQSGHEADVYLSADRCECTNPDGTRCAKPTSVMIDNTEMCLQHYYEWKERNKPYIYKRKQ